MKTETKIGALTRILLIAATVMLFIVSFSFAGTQKSEKECGDNAYKYYKSKGFDKMGCGKSTHYNAEKGVCIVRFVCDSNNGKKVSEFLENINEGKTLARYINTRPSSDTGTCMVNGQQCKDYHEYHNLIRPYIEK